jgi:uncharacterized membrane protein YedE/YeeE
MMRGFIALLSGTLFGVGLALSGMMNPARVRGFLDVFGHWDPTLAFVMGGALIVMAIAWRIQPRMHRPVVCEDFSLPGTRLIDAKLIGGSAIFGIGWGLGGLCPGPAIASLAVNFSHVIAFVVAMVAGMALFRLTEGSP